MKKQKILPLCNAKAIAEVAEELGLTKQKVKEIVDAQSEFTKKIMEGNTYDGVRWPYFGAFKVKTKQLQITKHMKGLNYEQKKQFRKNIKEGKVYRKGKSDKQEG